MRDSRSRDARRKRLVLGVCIAAGAELAASGCGDEKPPSPAEEVTEEESELVEGERFVREAPPVTLEGVARAYATEEARKPQRTDWGGGDASRGAELFASHCAICHGPKGTGEGLAALALNPKPRDLTEGTFYIDADADGETGEDVDLARVILEGPGAFGGSEAMQGWDEVFSDADVRDLVSYVRALSDPEQDAG